MRFFRSTPTLRADAFFDVRPIAIAVWMQPDSIQRRPRGLFGIRAQARTPPSAGPVSYKHPLSSAGSHGWCCCCGRRRTERRRPASRYRALTVHVPVRPFEIKPPSLIGLSLSCWLSNNDTFISTCVSGFIQRTSCTWHTERMMPSRTFMYSY